MRKGSVAKGTGGVLNPNRRWLGRGNLHCDVNPKELKGEWEGGGDKGKGELDNNNRALLAWLKWAVVELLDRLLRNSHASLLLLLRLQFPLAATARALHPFHIALKDRMQNETLCFFSTRFHAFSRFLF